MQGNLHRELRIQRLKRSGIGRMIDGIEPDLLRQSRVQHGRVVGRIQRAEPRSQCADTLIAIHLKVKNLHRQRIPRLRPVDEEGSSQRIVARSHAERISRLLDGVTEAVERVGVEYVSRLEMSHGRDRRVDVLHVVESALVLHDVGGRSTLRRQTGAPDQQGDEQPNERAYGFRPRSAHRCHSFVRP